MTTDGLLPVPPLVDPTPALAGKYRIAMVIDGKVHAVINLEAADAARYLSNPTFVQIPQPLYVELGYNYDSGVFSSPSV